MRVPEHFVAIPIEHGIFLIEEIKFVEQSFFSFCKRRKNAYGVDRVPRFRFWIKAFNIQVIRISRVKYFRPLVATKVKQNVVKVPRCYSCELNLVKGLADLFIPLIEKLSCFLAKKTIRAHLLLREQKDARGIAQDGIWALEKV